MDKFGYVYKITSPTGRIYIGSTININKRFNKYKNLHCKKQPKLYNSLKKYGAENHKFEIESKCFLEKMFYLEWFFGHHYNVLNYEVGLNLSLPNENDTYQNISDETKLKMSKSGKGKRAGEKHVFFGKKFSKEYCEKIRLGHKGKCKRGQNPHAKKVFCTETNKIWNCCKDASEELNINYGTLKSFLNGNRKNKTNLVYL